MARMARLLHLLLLSFLLSPALAGAAAHAGEFPLDQVVPKVATLASPEQQYSLYLPPGYDPARRWPLLILLDARGRAERIAMAVDGARRHGWIVMASYQSRSDTLERVTLFALQALLDESDRRFAADRSRLYLAGMSGTAKSLWTVAVPLRGSLAGMIGCAGGRDPGLPNPPRDTPPFYGCTGDFDFNHREMLALDAQLATAGVPHRLQRFAGGHGWMPDFGPAIDWLQLMAMRAGTVPRDAAWIQSRYAAERADGEARPDDYARWLALAPLVDDYRGLVPDDGLAARVQSLAATPLVQAQRKREDELADDERRYQGVVNEWAGRMRARFPDGRAQDPPTRGESLNALKIRTLQKQAAADDRQLAESARRRLELAYAAAHSYLPAEARERKQPAHEKAALAVAAAIFPERAAP
jgi:hypothetical protein